MEITDRVGKGEGRNTLWSNMLRLEDSGRLCIHKEFIALSSFVERVVKDGHVYSVCQPHTALDLEEAALASIWIHDRMRDAILSKCMPVCSRIAATCIS